MGIESLTSFLKKKAPNYIKQIDMSFCKTIALDGNQWMTSNLKSKYKEFFETMENPLATLSEQDEQYVKVEWLKDAVRFSLKWIGMKITPIWVMDGKSPDSKKAQKLKRQSARDSATHRFEELKTKINDRVSATDEIVPENDGMWVIDENKPISDEDRQKIISYRTQEKSLIPVWVYELKKMFSDIGIPWVQATDEGERCCCMLFHDKLVDAVYSTDTDNLCFNCDKIINAFKVETRTINGVLTYWMPSYDITYILNSLGFTHEEFVEFAITCGTDFNEGMPKVATVRAFELIQTYKSIKNFPAIHKKIPLDTTLLNEAECKRIFAIIPSNEVIKVQSDSLDINYDLLKNCELTLKKYMGATAARWLVKDIQRTLSNN